MTVQITAPQGLAPKHPEDDRFYKLDWSDWLASGVTISTSAWSMTGITDSNDSIVDSSTATQVRIAGGTDGTSYEAKNTITTSDGQTVVGILTIQVSDDANNV